MRRMWLLLVTAIIITASCTTTPSPGTEASLRRYINSLEIGRPNYDEMSPQVAAVVSRELPQIEQTIHKMGAFQSLTFKGAYSPYPCGTRHISFRLTSYTPCAPVLDVYDATFEHGQLEWHIAALDGDGRVVARGFRQLPASASPGAEAFLQRYIASLEIGHPNYDEMSSQLAALTREQLPQIEKIFHNLGSLKSLTFEGFAPNGMDLFGATFEHGQLAMRIAPIDSDGKPHALAFRLR